MKIKPITTAAALLLALTSTAAFAEPLDEDKRAECIGSAFFPLCETVYGVLDNNFLSHSGNELTKPGLIHLVDDLESTVHGYEDPENNNEYVPGIVDYVNDFRATLYGYVDENNEEVRGLVDAVADLDNRAAELEALNLEEVIYGNGKQGDEKTFGLLEAVDTLYDVVDNHHDVIESLETYKAEKSDLDKKADKVELDKKADKVALADKADKSQLATFQQQLDTKLSQADVDGKADKTELDKKADKADVIANKGAIAGLNNNVAANAAAINALNSSKLDKATFETLNTDFNKLQTAVSKLGTQVDANTARLGQLDRRVTKVQKEVRRGLATQSALAGLFQPYNVGKVNVTAAVGGYKSNTALAVGAGYRFNENVAAKAGVAVSTSGGGLSYNVGVNYEF